MRGRVDFRFWRCLERGPELERLPSEGCRLVYEDPFRQEGSRAKVVWTICAVSDKFSLELHSSKRSMTFESLLLCLYAIADLTNANPKVVYELGIPHAVRPCATVRSIAPGNGDYWYHANIVGTGRPCQRRECYKPRAPRFAGRGARSLEPETNTNNLRLMRATRVKRPEAQP
jgi:hypothetical protein